AYIAELRTVAEAVSLSNSTDFGNTAERLQAGLDDLEATTLWLQQTLAGGDISNALAGATPYLRLFGLAAGATYLAKGALGGDNTGWTTP
ncbi:acyl-CoA dehydrogenase C-terminal domain-containing protein, partial [Mycobacterium tuberculosis]|nr:acyl-CoA dehydrogenase C-terminal domain-containing protein [Mycobacterium tuberculosis]